MEVVVIIHLLAACVWVGGSIALIVAGVPAIRILEGEPRQRAMREIGLRWRPLGYSALFVLGITGVPLAAHDWDEGRSPFQTVLWVKVGHKLKRVATASTRSGAVTWTLRPGKGSHTYKATYTSSGCQISSVVARTIRL